MYQTEKCNCKCSGCKFYFGKMKVRWGKVVSNVDLYEWVLLYHNIL